MAVGRRRPQLPHPVDTAGLYRLTRRRLEEASAWRHRRPSREEPDVPTGMSLGHGPEDWVGPRDQVSPTHRLVNEQHPTLSACRQIDEAFAVGKVLLLIGLAAQRLPIGVSHARGQSVPTVVDYIYVRAPLLKIFKTKVAAAVGEPVAQGSAGEVAPFNVGEPAKDPLQVGEIWSVIESPVSTTRSLSPGSSWMGEGGGPASTVVDARSTTVVAIGTVVVAGSAVVVGGTAAVDGTAAVAGVAVVVRATVVGTAFVVGVVVAVVVGTAFVVGVVVAVVVVDSAEVGAAVSELPPHAETTNKTVTATACALTFQVCHPSLVAGGARYEPSGVDTCSG